ncbi:IucB [Klebsiella pneumoniae]|nr:IucB [Klebsiella pneumoniae]
MSKANIVHSGYGLRCERLDKPLNLSWGLDNSAVLRWRGRCRQSGCATRWIRYLSPHHNFQRWFSPGPNGVRSHRR